MTTTGVFTDAARLSELRNAFAGANKISVGFNPTGEVEDLNAAAPEQNVAENTFDFCGPGGMA
ncbi:MAG: hypothetical protein KAJ29_01675 [Alphaproteobacteria bacterium]|nr:hypothetical protein [Alphaproteobacteria bacterium]